MPDFPTQRLKPQFLYCAGDFKQITNFGAARPRGFRYCQDCRYRRVLHCRHPRLAVPFSLGTHAERMGCSEQRPA